MALEAQDTAAKFDPFELAADDRPYASYARIRDAGPLLRAGPGMWAVPRSGEVAARWRDTRIGPFRFQEIYQRFRPGAPAAAGGPARDLLEGILVSAPGARPARVR